MALLGKLNPLLYRGYVYDQETGLYYLQSRYYDPEIGRFINADGFTSTGQGFVGNNMFAYCNNNPINFLDRDGKNAETALAWWSSSMWWLCIADTAMPIGDALYGIAIIVLSTVTLATNQGSTPQITYDEATVTHGSPSPNNDEDDDDDYFNDDSNFGGKQKVGKKNGNAPRNNRAQNKQARDAAKSNHKRGERVTYKERQEIHRRINGQGYSYKEILDEIKYFGIPK